MHLPSTRQGACAIAYSGKCHSLRCHRYRYEPLLDETERAELADEIPAGRFATACEVADMAYSVITAPDYLTGQIITFDGGWI